MPPDSPFDFRYLADTLDQRRAGRTTGVAMDRCSGNAVFLKRGDAASLARELAVLLRLPAGVAPRPLDFARERSGQATLVLERLEGRTLLERGRDIAEDRLPEFALQLCNALSAIHRLGVVHADLKPANVFVLSDRARAELRLLDFESALGSLAGEGADGEARVIGTPPFLAPEVARSWSVDARADLYSLGVTLRTIFPWTESRPPWAELLDRLTEPRPSRRFESAGQFAAAIRDRFGSPADAPAPPRFPAGPMQGRAREVDAARAALDRSPVVLVQALPGHGLSRFLLEVASQVSADERLLRLLDLSRSTTPADPAWVASALDHGCAADERVLVGVPDPTPSLRWLPEALRSALTPRCDAAPRILLPPIEPAAIADALAASFADWRGDLDRLAQLLHARTAGDLRRAAAALDAAGTAAHEGPVDVEPLARALEADPPPTPALAEAVRELTGEGVRLAPQLAESLAIAARAPSGTASASIRELLEEFGHSTGLDDLLAAGLLADAQGAVRVVTDRMRRAACATPMALEPEIQRWLNAHVEPDLDHAGSVLESCARARALGDPAREATWLSAALERARARSRWDQLLALFSYGLDSGSPLDPATVSAHAARLAALLSPPWSPERLRLFAAAALKSRDPRAAAALWEAAAQGNDPASAGEALVALAEADLRRVDDAAFERRAQAIEALGAHVPAGVLPLKRAWQAQNHGRVAEAEAHAREAVEHLLGTGSPQEILALQQLAILCFGRDPAEGVSRMRVALGAARTATERAQVHYNVAMMLERSGDLDGCIAEAAAGLEQLAPGVQPRLEGLLRERRAWGWAALDRVREAAAEARALLDHRVVRHEATHRVVVRTLAGYCALHQGATSAALTDLVAAWRDSASGCPADLRAAALGGLVDALLDTGAWEFALQLDTEVDPGPGPAAPATELAMVRWAALRAVAQGDGAAAVAALESALDRARSVLEPEEQARWLHQLARARLGLPGSEGNENLERSAAESGEALAMLPARGRGLLRGRLLLARGEALGGRQAGAGDAALDEAVELARRIGARGLLGDALKARARLAIETGRTA